MYSTQFARDDVKTSNACWHHISYCAKTTAREATHQDIVEGNQTVKHRYQKNCVMVELGPRSFAGTLTRTVWCTEQGAQKIAPQHQRSDAGHGRSSGALPAQAPTCTRVVARVLAIRLQAAQVQGHGAQEFGVGTQN